MLRSLLFFCIVILATPMFAQDTVYRINSGDVLEISVWKEEGMEREVLVLPDGTISFPLAGHLKAAGLSPKEVQESITEKLVEYLPDSPVTVTVRETSGNRFFVVGQVNNPGQFLMSHQIDVAQALSLAQGLTAFGDENDIVILRRSEDGVQIAIPFDFSDIQDGENLESNILLQSGDIVIVPE